MARQRPSVGHLSPVVPPRFRRSVNESATIEYTSGMTRRRLFLGLGGLAMVVAVGYAVLELTAPPRLCVENFEKVKVGMTRTEVEAILGGGPTRVEDKRVIWFREGDTLL